MKNEQAKKKLVNEKKDAEKGGKKTHTHSTRLGD